MENMELWHFQTFLDLIIKYFRPVWVTYPNDEDTNQSMFLDGLAYKYLSELQQTSPELLPRHYVPACHGNHSVSSDSKRYFVIKKALPKEWASSCQGLAEQYLHTLHQVCNNL